MSATTVGEWVKRDRWKTSHFLPPERSSWVGARTDRLGVTICGKHVKVNEGLMPEPTGIDTTDRCERCRAKIGGAA